MLLGASGRIRYGVCANMDGPGPRQSRRTRSQRDRERLRRRAESQQRASSASSDSERPTTAEDGAGAAGRLDRGAASLGSRRRPPRPRKRESSSREEDIIDGFAIASFVSLEALETDCPVKTPEHVAFLRGRGSKRKRSARQSVSEAHLEQEGNHCRYAAGFPERASKRGRKPETAGNFLLETGYICDTESDSGDKVSENDVDPMFTVSTRKEPAPSAMGSSLRNGPSPQPLQRYHPQLSVTPRISGLQRSQERSLDLMPSEPSSAATSLSFARSGYSVSPPATRATNGRPPQPDASDSPKHKPFLVFPERIPSRYGVETSSRSSTLAKPPSSSSASSACTPTPAAGTTFPSGVVSGLSGAPQPQARSSSGTSLRSSPSLPPPPPLQQGASQLPPGSGGSSTAALPGPSLLNPELRSHFLTSQRTGGEAGGTSVETQANEAITSSASGEPLSSGCTVSVSAQAAVPPLAFQFHQHNHQHQHTHTHQHFTPFLPPAATAVPLFDKCSGKMEGLYRHPFFSQYPPAVPGIQSVLPSSGPFSSLQGAFQPKGTSPEMSPRLGPVAAHMQPKDHKMSDPFKTSSRVNKPGKWCAMHVRVAWMIFRHQEKVKADPRKLDFRSDMLARLPAAGLGPLGGVYPSSSTFVPPIAPHTTFLTPPGHFDPFGRLLPYTSLGSLGSGAFGGLGNTTLAVPGSLGPKESPGRTVGGSAGCHDSWKRLHRSSAFSTAPAWTQGGDKREEQEQATEKGVVHIKDERDRDCLAYGQRPGQESPVTPSRSVDREGVSSEATGPPKDGSSQTHWRDREKEGRPPSALSTRLHLAAMTERPRSSSSSAPPTPVPSVSLASSPLDLYSRRQPTSLLKPQVETSRPSQKENSFPVCPPTSLLSQDKKTDPSTVPVPRPSPNHPSPHLLPSVKVKEERKDELEPIPLLPPQLTHHGFDRPSGHPVTPSSAPLCLGSSPGIPLPPHPPHHHHLSLSLTPRTGGIVVGTPGDRYASYPHVLPQAHSQPAQVCPWDPWREQHREALSLRSDTALARLLQQHQAQRFFEAERASAAAVTGVPSSHHTPSSAPLSSSVRPEFGLAHHPHQEHVPQGAGGGGILDGEQRAHILREDYERARYYGMHPHAQLPGTHLASPSHPHLDPLYSGLLPHTHPHTPGASVSSHHSSFYSRLGPLPPHSRHLLSKATSGLVGTLSIGAPPPLIPSVTPSRASVSPRSSRFAPPPELVLYSTHKDRESR